jgi:AcrR family transcriptional regulator
MTSKIEQRAQATDRLAAHLLDSGLAQTSLRQLAAAAGISDRMLLYYFESKTDALSAALGQVAAHLTEMLEVSVPGDRKLTPADLLKATTALTRDPQTKPFFRLWTEAVAAAARGEAPYTTIANAIAEGFLGWVEARIEGGTPVSRRATAAMIVAMVDGLALLEICTDEKTAARAAAQMVTLVHPGF